MSNTKIQIWCDLISVRRNIVFYLYCYFMCGSVLTTGMSMYRLCLYCLNRPQDCALSSETGLPDCFESPCRYLEFNVGPLEEQPVSYLSSS